MRKAILTTAIIVSFLFPGADSRAEVPRWCPLCGMNLKMFHQTSNRLTFSDGSTVQTCSIFCAAQIYEKKATEIDHWEVVDYGTKLFIDARKAAWVIGSNVPGVMTAVGKLAFESLDEARKFQKNQGGSLGNFNEALNRTLTDMGSDRKMIMARMTERAKIGKELAVKQGCTTCHGPEGVGGSATAFNTPEFARKTDSRVKVKEVIMKGTAGMGAYEGKLNEKELHEITLFIWSLRPVN
ncbi:MAG: hypothetical protein C0407_09435 [Desulfobacca sp.]|nr:hypothetical protein [Desulfobacca sp.]